MHFDDLIQLIDPTLVVLTKFINNFSVDPPTTKQVQQEPDAGDEYQRHHPSKDTCNRAWFPKNSNKSSNRIYKQKCQ